MFDRELGERIRKARVVHGMTQIDLCEATGLSLSTIGLMERAGYMTKATAMKVCAVLGINAVQQQPTQKEGNQT